MVPFGLERPNNRDPRHRGGRTTAVAWVPRTVERILPLKRSHPMPNTKVVLTEKDLPTHWYNVQADLPFPLPPGIDPGTRQGMQTPDPAAPFAAEQGGQRR